MPPSDLREPPRKAEPSRATWPIGTGSTAHDLGPLRADLAASDAVVTGRHGGVSIGPFASLNLALHVGDDPARVLENRRRARGGARRQPRRPGGRRPGARHHRGRGDAAPTPAAGPAPTSDALAETDALVTAEPGVVLAILVADCAPVVLFDPEAGCSACVHAGWRGALAGRRWSPTLASMAALGAQPERQSAPASGRPSTADRYEVGPDVLGRAAPNTWASTEPGPGPAGPGHWLVRSPRDRPRRPPPGGAARRTHRGCGRSTGAPGPFYSDREQGTCGRFALLARIRAVTDRPHSPTGATTSTRAGGLTCRYSLGARDFVERFEFGPGRLDYARRRLEAARLVYLLAGVSYYKTAAPPVVDVWTLALRPAELSMLSDFYRHGLAEFAYRNGLDLAGARSSTPTVNDAPPVGELPRPPTGRSCPSAAGSTRS